MSEPGLLKWLLFKPCMSQRYIWSCLVMQGGFQDARGVQMMAQTAYLKVLCSGSTYLHGPSQLLASNRCQLEDCVFARQELKYLPFNMSAVAEAALNIRGCAGVTPR